MIYPSRPPSWSLTLITILDLEFLDEYETCLRFLRAVGRALTKWDGLLSGVALSMELGGGAPSEGEEGEEEEEEGEETCAVEEEEDDDDTGTLEDAPVTGEIDSRAVTATNRDRGCLWRGVGEKRQTYGSSAGRNWRGSGRWVGRLHGDSNALTPPGAGSGVNSLLEAEYQLTCLWHLDCEPCVLPQQEL